MYAVPSVKQAQPQIEPRRLNPLHYLGWFALTATLSFLSVFLSSWLHAALSSRLQIELDPADLITTPLIFGSDPGPAAVLLLAWCVVPALLISTIQATLLVSENFLNLKALIFIGLCVLIWGAAISLFLKLYPEPEGFSAEIPSIIQSTTAMAALVISCVSLILSTSQWLLLRSAPRMTAWMPSNALGYSIGWSLGMYVLSRSFEMSYVDTCPL